MSTHTVTPLADSSLRDLWSAIVCRLRGDTDFGPFHCHNDIDRVRVEHDLMFADTRR